MREIRTSGSKEGGPGRVLMPVLAPTLPPLVRQAKPGFSCELKEFTM